MALEDAAKNAMLDYLDTIATHVSLHTGFPATGGNELTGGSPAYARLTISFDAASGGSMSMTGTKQFDCPATTVSSCGLWSASTAGTLYGGADLTDEVFSGQGTYTLTALTVSIT